jgi:ribosome assembly protein 1
MNFFFRLECRNPEKVNKITTSLSLKLLPRDLKSKDSRHLLQTIFSQWLSLSTCIIQTAIDVVPPPPLAQRLRVPRMLYPDNPDAETVPPKDQVEKDLYEANKEDEAFVCAYVSKMFAVRAKDLPDIKRERAERAAAAAASSSSTDGDGDDDEEKAESSDEEEEILLGFARLYSGTLHLSSTLKAVLPKYDPTLPHAPTNKRNEKYVVEVKVEGLYLMMGKELVKTESVIAGNIFAVRGLAGKVGRSATLCSGGDGALINLGRVVRAVSYLFIHTGIRTILSLFSFL